MKIAYSYAILRYVHGCHVPGLLERMLRGLELSLVEYSQKRNAIR